MTMQDIEMPPDAETEFSRRLAMKLSERGYSGAVLADNVEELLRNGVKLKLDIDDITRI